LGLALHNFHDAHGSFPPARIDTPQTAWPPFIFPYIEQDNFYNRYSFTASNSDPANDGVSPFTDASAAVNQIRVAVLLCPSAPDSSTRLGQNKREVMDYSAANAVSQNDPYITLSP